MNSEYFADIWQDDWDSLLTPEEQAVFFRLNDEEQDKYLTACTSYEAMKAYLEDPASPPAAKRLLDLQSWK
jgi:hypothetical protein